MSTPVIGYDQLHPPRLVTCHHCGSERLSRRDHPGLEGESRYCPDCRRDASTLRAAVDTLRVTHPSLAVQLRQMAERFEGSTE